MLGLKADVVVGLDQERGHAGFAAPGCPLVVEPGEVVVDPHERYVTGPHLDGVSFPEVPVRVAGRDVGARQGQRHPVLGLRGAAR